jgi:hypothetical protein
MKSNSNKTIVGKLFETQQSDESQKSETLAEVVLVEIRRMQKEIQPSVFRQKPKRTTK